MERDETDKAFAKRVGIDATSLSHWRGNSSAGVSIASLVKVAMATGASLDWLVFGTRNRGEDEETQTQRVVRNLAESIRLQLENVERALETSTHPLPRDDAEAQTKPKRNNRSA